MPTTYQPLKSEIAVVARPFAGAGELSREDFFRCGLAAVERWWVTGAEHWEVVGDNPGECHGE